MNVSNRLYRITTYGCMMLFIVYLFLCSDYVRAEDDEIAVMAAICASSNGIIATQMDSSIILEEAQWWIGFLKEWVGPGPASLLTQTTMANLQDGYNSGALTWGDIVDIAEACNPLREELIRLEK